MRSFNAYRHEMYLLFIFHQNWHTFPTQLSNYYIQSKTRIEAISMKDTLMFEEELAEVVVGVDEVEVGVGSPQVHWSSLLQLLESQVQTIELTSPSLAYLQWTPKIFFGSHLLSIITWSPVSVMIWIIEQKNKMLPK